MCDHMKLTIEVKSHMPSDEPPYIDALMQCDECGAMVDFDDRPAGAIIRDTLGHRLDMFERGVQDA